MSTINNIVLERFDLLPKAIQEAIVHSGWSEKVRIICKTNHLPFDVGVIVENATLMVMVGVLSAEELLEEIKEEGISEEVAQNVIREIDAQIFLPIKKELIDTFDSFEKTESSVPEEDNSLDILAGNPHIGEKNEDEEREQTLKEIEDFDSAISQNNNKPQEETKIIEQKVENVVSPTQTPQKEKLEDVSKVEVKPEPNSIEQKLVGSVSAQPQIVKIDPYREPIE